MFDKDNTLTLPYSRTPHPSISQPLTHCLDLFGRKNVAIVSNSVGSKDDHGYKEAILLESALGISVIRHQHKKPDVSLEIQQHFNLSLDQAWRVAMIGDRTMSDTIMGNQLGYFTIEVQPFDTARENRVVKAMRWVEGNVLPLIDGGKAPKHKILEGGKNVRDLVKG